MSKPVQLEIISRLPATKTGASPLLFVHGMWHGAWCWDEYFLPYFASQGYEAYAVSLRGHAGSSLDGSLKFVSMADYVADVAHAAAQIGTPPVVIGHSEGGFVVQRYLEKHAAPGAVLLATIPARGTLAASLRAFLHEPLNFLKCNVVLDLYPLVDTPERAQWCLFTDRQQALTYYPRLQSEAYRAYFETLLPIPRPRPAKTPMLVIAAERDNFFSVREARQTAWHHDADAVAVIPGAHDLMLEPSWQQAADRIVAWLREKQL